MWNKTERFVLATGLYEYLLEPTHISENAINWDFIVDNCLYQKDDIDLLKIEKRFKIFLQNEDLYINKIEQYLQNLTITPQIVISILISFFIEIDESLAKSDETIEGNFLGKYPRLTQEVIAGEYTSLVNAIVRKVASDKSLIFEDEE
jgi:hypothetical protein